MGTSKRKTVEERTPIVTVLEKYTSRGIVYRLGEILKVRAVHQVWDDRIYRRTCVTLERIDGGSVDFMFNKATKELDKKLSDIKTGDKGGFYINTQCGFISDFVIVPIDGFYDLFTKY